MMLVRWAGLMEGLLVLGFLAGFVFGMTLGAYAWWTLM